jgi:hypothetical protein
MPPNMSAKSTISKRHMRRFHRQRPPQPPAWRARVAQAGLPQWIRPQTDRARRRLDWTHKYSPIGADVAVLGRAPGLSRLRIVRRFSRRHDPGRVGCRQRRRVGFFIFDLLRLDRDDVSALPLIERKSRLAALRWMSRRRCITAITTADRVRLSMSRFCKLELEHAGINPNAGTGVLLATLGILAFHFSGRRSAARSEVGPGLRIKPSRLNMSATDARLACAIPV